MVPLQKKSLPVEELAAHGVSILYLFGSQAEGVAGPTSDIDVAVVFRDSGVLAHRSSELYQKLYDILTDVFDMSNFRNIDIVFLDRAPLELRFDVVRHGSVLYETDPDARLDFEERTAALYRDFKPMLDLSDEAILARI